MRYHLPEMPEPQSAAEVPVMPLTLRPNPFPSPLRFPARRLTGALLLAIALLTACAGPGPAPQPRPSATTAAGEAAFDRGDYAEAAAAWQREALNAPPQQAAALRVRAADAWLLAGDPDSAESVLRWVLPDDLPAAERKRLDLVRADLALRKNRPDEAEALLARAARGLPRGLETRYDTLQARLQGQLARPGSRNLALAAQRIESMTFYNPAATQELMQILENVSSGELAIRAANPRAERQLTGWLDLALEIRRNLVVPDSVTGAIAGWKGRHPHHLLTESQALDTWLRYRQRFDVPRKVAVLLPDSGRLESAGAAIRDGLMSAYITRPGGADLQFFPTGDDLQTVISAYFNALDTGADLIIGPLRKEAVEAMLNLAGLATPVLALNDLPEGYLPPPGLTGQIAGLSLSQEAEVAAIAAHAAASGYQRAMVLAPESEWGERMARIFVEEFLQDDRQIVAANRYLQEENDHSSLLERALEIDESKARGQRLENTLQVPLEFEPVRRTDVDVIFMAANDTQAKLLRPQLRFLDAGDIPVYGTGRIYSGAPDPAFNQDLDGVRFPTTPWALAHASREEVPQVASLKNGTLGALFAVGQDAWNLLPWLNLMRKDPGFVFPGLSGRYRMDLSGRLQREPAWAVFVDGRPRPLPIQTPPERTVPAGLPNEPGPVPDVASR